MHVRCPAKVNTFLSVGPRDTRGYHPVRTVLQAVGLFDELELTVANRDEIVCDWAGLPLENTMTKALRFLRELAQLPPLRIVLTKRIPSQAGLGGGSSNAAGVIRAARAMLPEQVNERFAFEVATAVGADVPFFLVGGRAKATGYGEVVEPLPDLSAQWLVIVKPADSVSTKEAYAALDAAPREWRGFEEVYYNDFERVSPCACGEIAERLRVFGATDSLLCGAGSAVFGVFDSQERAECARDKARDERLGQAWAVRTLTREESLWTS